MSDDMIGHLEELDHVGGLVYMEKACPEAPSSVVFLLTATASRMYFSLTTDPIEVCHRVETCSDKTTQAATSPTCILDVFRCSAGRVGVFDGDCSASRRGIVAGDYSVVCRLSSFLFGTDHLQVLDGVNESNQVAEIGMNSRTSGEEFL